MNKEDIQEASKILFEHRLNKTGLSSLKNLEPVSYTHLTLPTT